MGFRLLFKITWIARCAVIWIVVSGCTHTLDVPTVAFTDYRNKDKIKLHLALRLSDELLNAKSERTQGFDKFIIPLGDHLAVNAEFLSQVIFTDVTVLKDDSVPNDKGIRAILIPTMISSARVSPISAFIKQTLKIAVVLEWALKDRENHLIWIDTVTGEGTLVEPTSSADGNRKNLMQSLIQDLFQKSYEALSSSPEIRKFAAEQIGRNAPEDREDKVENLSGPGTGREP